jgi:hypothetical protein
VFSDLPTGYSGFLLTAMFPGYQKLYAPCKS